MNKMQVYRSPSGRLHLTNSCTGGASRRNTRKTTLTEEEFEQANKCRCLRTFHPGWKALGGRSRPVRSTK